MKVNRLKRDDRCYPSQLANITDPPKELYSLGANITSWIDKPKVAIVGSRKVTSYGREVTARLAEELAAAGVVIISGLALGVDSIAHQGALDGSGITVAVMPGGLDRIYPATHRNLAKQIIKQGGTLISEYPLESEIRKYHFIARNRIISGLSDVLIITEATAGSGSLHTANFALEQGKTVMVVPGNINSPYSMGANNLIKSGALPLTETADVFFTLGITPGAKNSTRVFVGTPEQEAVLKEISDGLSDQETIAVKLNLDAPTIGFILTYLEINGYVRPTGSGHWQAI